MKEIITKKLRLKPMDTSEWESYVSHVIDAGEVYLQYGLEPSDELLKWIKEPTQDVIYYSIVPHDAGEAVGYVGITPSDNNLEYYVFREHRRKGYGSEAVAAFTSAYLAGAVTGGTEEAVVAETLTDNYASIGMLEKIGYQKHSEGIMILRDCSAAAVSIYTYPGCDDDIFA